MNLYVLDTDILSLLQRGHARIVQRCAAKAPGGVAITVCSVEEQLSGRIRFIRKVTKPDDVAQAYQSLIDTLRSFSKLPIISFSAGAFARYRQNIMATVSDEIPPRFDRFRKST